jgi:hypothetical protein
VQGLVRQGLTEWRRVRVTSIAIVRQLMSVGAIVVRRARWPTAREVTGASSQLRQHNA